MPRGMNPNSRKNLKTAYGGKGGFDTETARKANEKSQESKAVLKTFQQLDAEDPATPESRIKMLKRLRWMAERGNLRAFEIYRDTMGLKPRDEAGGDTYEGESDGFEEALNVAAAKVWDDGNET